MHIAHFKSQYCGFVSYNLASMFRVTGGLSTQRKDKRCQIKCRLKTSACISVLMKTQHGLSTVACSSSIPAHSTADAREITTRHLSLPARERVKCFNKSIWWLGAYDNPPQNAPPPPSCNTQRCCGNGESTYPFSFSRHLPCK